MNEMDKMNSTQVLFCTGNSESIESDPIDTIDNIDNALFRSELDEAALADIRHALSQGQPLGHGRFSDKICAAAGIRRTQKRPGRPAGKADQPGDTETQNDFGF